MQQCIDFTWHFPLTPVIKETFSYIKLTTLSASILIEFLFSALKAFHHKCYIRYPNCLEIF